VRWVMKRMGSSAWLEIEKTEQEIGSESTQYSVLSTQDDGAGTEGNGSGRTEDGGRRNLEKLSEPYRSSSIYAVADPQEKWWERLRGNPKRAGEISQAAFLLKAETLGFDLALPWGDNQKFDFVVWRRDGKAFRVQVKGTGRLHRRGYEVQPVHSTRGSGKKRYTKKDIDVIAAHVQPVDAWYLIPIEKVGKAKSLRLYPGIEGLVKNSMSRRVGKMRRRQRTRVWEQWRDRWEVLGER